MLAGALIAFVPTLFGIAALGRYARRVSRHHDMAEARSSRRREAWEAVAEYDLRRAA